MPQKVVAERVKYMASVIQRIAQVKQPRGGYINFTYYKRTPPTTSVAGQWKV